MKLNRFLFFLLIFCVGKVLGQSYPLWKNIEPGPYTVGFKSISTYDSSRNLTAPVNFRGDSIENYHMPVQVNIWYPAAEEWSAEKAMKFQDYFYLTLQKNDFRDLNQEEKKGALSSFVDYAKALKINLDSLLVDDIQSQAVAAIENAQPLSKKFPLILSGLDGGPSNNSILYEFLASHGYIVISNPSLSSTAGLQFSKPTVALDRRIRNFEFLRAYALTLPYVDEKNTGLLGINFDGLTAILYQMKNKEAKAIVSLDGWEAKHMSRSYLDQHFYFNPRSFHIPYLTFQHDEIARNPGLIQDSVIFNSLKYSERYYYTIKNIGHAYLTGPMLALPLDNSVLHSYEFIYEMIRTFFDRTLKGESKEMIMEKAPEKTFIRKMEVAAAFDRIPDREEFLDILNKDIKEANSIILNAKKEDPTIHLLDLILYHRTGRRFAQNPEKALQVYLTGVVDYPEASWAWIRLGNAYLELLEKQKAIESFKKAVALIPYDQGITDKETLITSVLEEIEKHQ